MNREFTMSIPSQYDNIQAVANVFRLIADFVNDLSLMEREYDFEFMKLGELVDRINFNEILQGQDSKLLHAVIPMVKLSQLLPRLNDVFISSYNKKKELVEGLNSVCSDIESFAGRSTFTSRVRDLDPELIQNCANKNYRDTANNAFPLIEDRLRHKLNVDRSRSGNNLIDYAFSTSTGKLSISDSSSEQEGILLLFKGVFTFLRNPPAHTLSVEEGRDAAIKLLYMADLLLKIVEKASFRP
jgi:uncharacterized protein (TIGR02391 family)